VLEDVVVVARLVERQRVLKARASAAAHGDTQRLVGTVALVGEQLLDLARGLVGQGDR
jgi:hypothetical protein